MAAIHLVSVGRADDAVLTRLGEDITEEMGVPCFMDDRHLDPSIAFHPERGQYHSSEIIKELGRLDSRGTWMLGVTPLDLFIPILTFVFGEAETGGRCAAVSFHRLRQEFYGLPPDDDLLFDRLLKEANHEIGHLWGLHHCDNYACVMAPSHAVEWVDLKGRQFCDHCRGVQSRARHQSG